MNLLDNFLNNFVNTNLSYIICGSCFNTCYLINSNLSYWLFDNCLLNWSHWPWINNGCFISSSVHCDSYDFLSSRSLSGQFINSCELISVSTNRCYLGDFRQILIVSDNSNNWLKLFIIFNFLNIKLEGSDRLLFRFFNDLNWCDSIIISNFNCFLIIST